MRMSAIKVRAAAVTALAKFGAECQQLRKSVEVLLKRCLLDTDDEVRDRATFYLSVLRSGDSSIITEYILNTLKVATPQISFSERQASCLGVCCRVGASTRELYISRRLWEVV